MGGLGVYFLEILIEKHTEFGVFSTQDIELEQILKCQQMLRQLKISITKLKQKNSSSNFS